MATYIPNATQTTEPVESRTVESAALEFRTLKTSINARIEDVQDNLDAEIVNRIAGDANLQAQNNAQDVRLTAIENALPFIGEGGLPGTVYVQRFSGTGVQTVFTLNAVPQSGNAVDIYINGLYQNKNTFSVAGAVITFSEAPPAGTDNIEVQVTVTIALGETDASLVTYNATTVEAQLDSISAASGSNLVGFQQAGAGAVVRTAQDKMREWVSVKDFGAVGDGVADDSAAWEAFIAASAGVKLVTPGSYLISGQVKSFGSPVIYDNVQTFPKGVGTETQSVDFAFDQRFGALRVGASDTVPLDDQHNYWRGLPLGSGTNSWREIFGLFSSSFGRNGASAGAYSATFGHDCITYGVAALAGGAGSCAGDPDAPTSPGAEGYCSVAWGKNVLAKGSKSAAFCEESKANSRASVAAGYFSEAGEWASDGGVAATAIGYEVKAYGSGSVALGRYATAQAAAIAIGRGLSTTEPMLVSSASIGLGYNVTKPTITVEAGSGASTDYGAVSIRGSGQTFYGNTGLQLSQVTQSLTNGGAGGYGDFHIRPRVAGAIADGWRVDAGLVAGGIVSLMPAVDNAMRLGSASYRPEVIFSATGTINTSDARDKQQVRDITVAERAVAIRIKGLLRAFRFNDAVQSKGDGARWHFGAVAQDVKAAFEAEGLDPFAYALLCYDEFDGGSRYGVRYEELLAFIVAAL